MRRPYLLGFSVSLTILFLGPTLAPAADEKPIRALLVAGGCCHDYAHQKDILVKGIAQRCDIEFVVAYDPDTTTKHPNPVYEKADWSKGFDVIIHDECTAEATDQSLIDRVLEPHKHGLPAVNLHCAMHCYRAAPYPKTTAWMEFTGMNTNHHGQQRPIAVAYTDPASPITRSLDDWGTIQEELYHPEQLLPTAHALANGYQNVRREAEAVVVWTNDYHGTRVFSTTLGHNNETVNDPRYLDLVTCGLLWSLNKLDAEHFKKVTGK